MKRTLAFLSALLILALFIGCSSNKVCTAVVEKIENKTMLVRPVEGSSELSSSDLFSVSMEHLREPPREPRSGDVVTITYDGDILEIYPAVFEKVIRVDLVAD